MSPSPLPFNTVLDFSETSQLKGKSLRTKEKLSLFTKDMTGYRGSPTRAPEKFTELIIRPDNGIYGQHTKPTVFPFRETNRK